MARHEIRISGFGGQGVILTGYVVGKAAAVHQNKHATMNQAYGPEARGSACSAQVVISDEAVGYPYMRRTDVLLAMSQEGYRIFIDEVREDGLVLIDDSLVTPDAARKVRTLGIPATRIAEELGKRVYTNMVMIGFLVAQSGVLSRDAAIAAIKESVPSGTEDKNLKAFEAGFGHSVDKPPLKVLA